MKMNKKGFTIVELVIVIAVIAILAGVMIPTFGGVIESANETAAAQEAANVHKAVVIADPTKAGENYFIQIDAKYVFEVKAGVVELKKDTTVAAAAEELAVTGYTAPEGVKLYKSVTAPTPATPAG